MVHDYVIRVQGVLVENKAGLLDCLPACLCFSLGVRNGEIQVGSRPWAQPTMFHLYLAHFPVLYFFTCVSYFLSTLRELAWG